MWWFFSANRVLQDSPTRRVSSLYTVVQALMHLAGVKQYWRVHPLKNSCYVKSFQYFNTDQQELHNLLFNTDLRDIIPSYSPTHRCIKVLSVLSTIIITYTNINNIINFYYIDNSEIVFFFFILTTCFLARDILWMFGASSALELCLDGRKNTIQGLFTHSPLTFGTLLRSDFFWRTYASFHCIPFSNSFSPILS